MLLGMWRQGTFEHLTHGAHLASSAWSALRELRAARILIPVPNTVGYCVSDMLIGDSCPGCLASNFEHVLLLQTQRLDSGSGSIEGSSRLCLFALWFICAGGAPSLPAILSLRKFGSSAHSACGFVSNGGAQKSVIYLCFLLSSKNHTHTHRLI